METNIRELKANLSRVIRRVEAGETVTVNVRNRPVARIVPMTRRTRLEDLARIPGLSWRGGKPAGIRKAERMPAGVRTADWVIEDRR